MLALMYMAGIAAFFKGTEIFMSLIVFSAAAFLLLRGKITKTFAIISILAFIFGIFYTDLKMKSDDLLSDLAPANLTITGRVTSIPTTGEGYRTRFYLNATKAETSNEVFDTDSKTFVTVVDEKSNFEKIRIGDELKIKTKVRLPSEATNPAQFSYKNYLKNFNTFTTAYVQPEDWQITSRPTELKWKFMQNLNLLRQSIIAQHGQVIKSPNLEILGGIVFGDDAISPPQEVKDSFRGSGLMHILAASGFNVAIIFSIWYFIFMRLKIPYKTGVSIGIFLIIFYTFMTGLGPPVLRAALMLTFALIGKLIDRNADNKALLMFVASIILVYNPAFLFDVGFELSFIVTFGLLTCCPIAAEKTAKIPQVLAGAVYVPLIAQIMVAPIQMFYFNTFATYSLIANILSLPFVSAISFLGFVSSILAMIPKFPPIIISIFDHIMNPLLTILVKISDFCAGLPNALFETTQCNLWQIMLYYIIVAALFAAIKNGFTKKLLTATIVTLTLLMLTIIPPRNSNLEAIFFDVGNADAILVKTPDHKYILIDTANQPSKSGFSSAKTIIYEYLKDHGIKTMDYMIVTHYDSDHAGGAIQLLELLKVKNIVLNSYKGDSPFAESIPKAAKLRHTNIIYPKNNTELLKYKNGSLKIFQSTEKELDDNSSSLITLMNNGENKILFTGDANANVINSLNLPPNISVLKVGHHGAKFTTDEKFLKEKGIKTAVISTGTNDYGHPTPPTIKTLQKSGVQILRTDSDNAVKVVLTKKGVKTLGFDEEKKHFVPVR